MENKNAWKVIERPGYLGSKKDEKVLEWNTLFGENNWRISWLTATGERLTYENIIDLYIEGYVRYFEAHTDELSYIVENFSYGYDLDLQTKEEAFDIYGLYEKPGKRNQFHQVAFNLAIENFLQKPFKGTVPVQVRDSKPGTPEKDRPLGWRWNPGLIPCSKPELIPTDVTFVNPWWNKGSIEDLYQSTKVLEAKIA